MSVQSVREYFRAFGIADRVKEFEASSATVRLAANALGCEPCRIAKTLAFWLGDRPILVVTAGDAKIDNHKYKERFHAKAKMLSPEEVLDRVGHAVGGVCPFAIPKDVEPYLDESLKRFETVFPACGSAHSAIELTIEELWKFSNASDWVDVCKVWQDEEDK